MRITILTVSNKGDILQTKLKKLISNKHQINVKKFPLKCDYKGKSDNNNCVIKSIWNNTLECIREGIIHNNYVCVIQDDFIPNDNIDNALNNSEQLLINNNNIDMIFLSANPTCKFNKINDNFGKVTYCTGWQCVIYNKSFLNFIENNNITIPNEQHNDVYFNNFYKNNINAYIHIPSSGIQSTERFLRKLEYSFLYNIRYKYSYGDPLYLIFIIIVVLIVIFILKKCVK